MIELNKDQSQAIEREPEKPAIVVDPRTGQHYRLIKEEIYKLMQGMVKPFNRNWDNPEDDDLIR
ncbi:MAG: hypothetical protein ACRELG_12330 [Gemmataceae bacterium]